MAGQPLKIAIDANFLPGAGGISQAVLGLVQALGELDGPETYEVIVESDAVRELFASRIGPRQVLRRRPIASRPRAAARVSRHIKWRLARLVEAELEPWPTPQLSDGFVESLDADVLHIPTQGFSVCSLPTIYNPHDLQHRHLPQFFDPYELARRDVVYGAGCRFSHTVAVASQWVKDDVVSHFSIDPAKVQVIPWAAPTHAYPTPTNAFLAGVREGHALPAEFLLYPAKTWSHKNHSALVEALAILRDRDGLHAYVICTGGIDEKSWSDLQKLLDDHHLEDRVQFLGHVSEDELRALYALATALVVPTLFEAASFPIFEAWLDGLPVACSNVTSLPAQVGDAGIVFEPQPESIASALRELLTRPELRQELAERGRLRSQLFTWEKTAKAYRALYRRAARRPLDDEDLDLLEHDWMSQATPVLDPLELR